MPNLKLRLVNLKLHVNLNSLITIIPPCNPQDMTCNFQIQVLTWAFSFFKLFVSFFSSLACLDPHISNLIGWLFISSKRCFVSFSCLWLGFIAFALVLIALMRLNLLFNGANINLSKVGWFELRYQPGHMIICL